LHRHPLRLFGYGTATLARLMRFRRFLSLDTMMLHTASVARLAVAAGYSDQAHLTRECRAITGDTPRTFLADYWPTFPNMSDPYKTREQFLATMVG
jgi:AraC-like DNA-binding protein